MAEILGYKNNLYTDQDSVDWLKDKIGDVFANIEVSEDKKTLTIKTEDGDGFKLVDSSTSNKKFSNIYIISNNIVSPTFASYFFVKTLIVRTSSGIIITGGYSNGNSYNVVTVCYNLITKAIASVGAYEDAKVSSQKVSYLCVGKNGTFYAPVFISSYLEYYFMFSDPYPIIAELPMNNEKTGIYLLTHGMIINGCVSDGTTDVFISRWVGLPD